MANLSLRGVEKFFTNFKAVQDLNLDVEDGEFFALLGPSGCGKTTTMRMIAGLQLPSAGKIMINGRDVTDIEPARRNVAMVFQDYALYPHMTLTENVGYPLKVRGLERPNGMIGSVPLPSICNSKTFLIGDRGSCLAASNSARQSAGRLLTLPMYFCSMNRFRIWMRNCGSKLVHFSNDYSAKSA